MQSSAGFRFRQALKEERPLQIVGAINAFVALMAKEAGFRALYLSGAGVANASHGLPDLGLTTLDNVLEEVRRIAAVVDLPLLVDIDTGWGNTLMIRRAVQLLIGAGAAAIHIEDQPLAKRCGHRPDKKLVSIKEMVARIRAAVEAKTDPHFVVMARIDALAVEGWQATVERGCAYRDAGAEMLFLEACPSLQQYQAFKKETRLPLLANLTEFGKAPLFTVEELRKADVDMALYPLSVMRAMNRAAGSVLQEIREQGTQKALLNTMQTREELYRLLDYERLEKEIDREQEP
jgi:methylisocitrate lyase